MSGRTKKTTTTTTTVTSKSSAATSTPASSGASARTPGSAARPPSPTMISRIQEKNELASLNDRLATYIERVRQLESENSKLTRIVQSQEETVTKETTKIKGLYENELASARKLLDDTAKEKAKLQMENGSLRKELEELREKLKTKERDLTVNEKKLLSAESQVSELQARLNDAVNQRRYYEDEYNKLKKEYDAMVKAMAQLKKSLEDETIARVDLENRMQSLREDLAFKAQIHEQELNESVHRSRVVVEEVDNRLQEEYDSKLREALQQMREENDEQIRLMRVETETIFEKKLQNLAPKSEVTSEKTLSEIRNLKSRSNELNSEITRLTTLNHNMEARVRDLENQLKREQDDHSSTVDSLKSQITHLKLTLDEQLVEYRDLMDVKIQLDTEIAAYRKLLESEESRLKIPGTPGRTPFRSGTPSESSRKRKRVELEASFAGSSSGPASFVHEASSSSDYVLNSSAKDIIEVKEISPDGKFIKLVNTSTDKDAAIGGWQLRHVVGDNETTFKFHRSVNVKPGMFVTVWSADSDKTHSPPTDILMKGQTWFAGETMKTTLLDQKGEEMATLLMEKRAIRTSTSYVRSDAGASESQQSSSSKSSKGWLSFLGLLS